MVERLKEAIQKARERREASGAPAASAPRPAAPTQTSLPVETETAWNRLKLVAPSPSHLKRERIVSLSRSDPAYAAFDILRTRILKVCRDQNWVRIGIVSPTKGCGKSLVAANLAFSISRQTEYRVALLDMDLRAPRLAAMLGVEEDADITAFLRGEASIDETFTRLHENLAVAVNTKIERNPSELMQSAACARAFDLLVTSLRPNIALFDLPPMLTLDDSIGILPSLDAVLLVAASGSTTAKEIDDCERTIVASTQFLGVVLNKCEDTGTEPYLYGYESD
jgi:Mrp family chromosome partitioning ATPase